MDSITKCEKAVAFMYFALNNDNVKNELKSLNLSLDNLKKRLSGGQINEC